LTEYQHVHPEPTRRPGECRFLFTPRLGGRYRFFADFTPVATARSLYANADLVVEGPGEPGVDLGLPGGSTVLNLIPLNG
jgi:hypothetical protein